MTLTEGCRVRVKEEVLARYVAEARKKFTGRIGIVERLFVPLGGSRQRTRILWLKKANRGREFYDVEYADNLEPVT